MQITVKNAFPHSIFDLASKDGNISEDDSNIRNFPDQACPCTWAYISCKILRKTWLLLKLRFSENATKI